MRRTARILATLLAIVAITLAVAAVAAATAAPTQPARSPPAAAPIIKPAAAAKPQPIPDFEPFSPEEEEQVINLPAREEIGGAAGSGAATSPAASASASANSATAAKAKPAHPAKPKPSTSLTKELPIVSLDVSGDTKLRALCASLPLNPSPAASAASSLALPHLTQLLKALWVGSGLLDAGVGDHLLRVRVAELQRQQLEAAFRSSSAAATAGRLREEDLPELFDASMAVLKTMDIDLEAEARLDLARGEAGLVGLTDDFSPHLSSRPGAGQPSVWNAPLHLLRVLGLHPTSQDEVDAFWFLSCVLAVVCASIGVGWALGRRAAGGSGSLAAEVNETLAAGRRKRRKQIWVAVGWIALACAVVVLIALVAGISQELAEERRRLITKRALAQASGPPKGCREGETLSWWHEIARSWRKEDDDPCVAYLERVERSIQPDRFKVAADYILRHTVVMLARSAGDSVAAVLSSQTYLVQMMLPVLLVALFAVLIALGTPTMVKTLLCCCCSRNERDDDRAARRNNRARIEAGSSRRRLKEDRPRREMIESGSDSEAEEEAREQKRLIQEAVRAAITEVAASSSSSSGSARDAPRLTSGSSHRSGSGRRDRRPSSRDTSPVRSRSRSHSRDRRRVSRSRSPQPRQRRSQRDEESDRPAAASSSSAAVAAPSKSPPSSASKQAKKQAKAVAAAAAAAASPQPVSSSPPEPLGDAAGAAAGPAVNASDAQ